MWKIVINISFSIIVLLPATAFAVEVEGLYQAEVRVISQQAKERTRAMSAALSEVLLKVSGRSSVLAEAAVKGALRKPTGYLQGYRYRELSFAEQQSLLAEQTGSPDLEASGDPQLLVFSFDKTAVDKLLADNHLSIWGATRPSVIAWLAVQDENGRILLGSNTDDAFSKAVIREARRHGLPLLLPLMDLEDQRALRFADVWGGFPEPVLTAAARYRTEIVLMGRLYRDAGDLWQAQWTVLEGRTRKSWNTRGDSPAAVIRAGIAGSTELLALRYAPASGPQRAGLLPMTINGVRNLGDYSRVSSYLASLQQVAQVHITQVEPERIHFDLIIEGAPEGIVKTIALGDVLLAVQTATDFGQFRGQAEGPPTVLPSPLGNPVQVYQLRP